MKKALILCFFAVLFLMLLLPVAANASGCPFGTRVLDRADLLSDAAVERINAQQGQEIHGVCFFLITADKRMDKDQVVRACSITSGMDALVLVVDRTDGVYYYEMFTFNAAHGMFSDKEADAILDNDAIYNAIKSGRVEEGSMLFFAACADQIHASYLAEQQAQAQKPLRALIVGAISFVAVGGITMLCVALYYRRKQHGETYPLDRYASLNLTVSEDRFVGSYVTRVRVQSGSSSGGGGSSGGSRGRR